MPIRIGSVCYSSTWRLGDAAGLLREGKKETVHCPTANWVCLAKCRSWIKSTEGCRWTNVYGTGFQLPIEALYQMEYSTQEKFKQCNRSKPSVLRYCNNTRIVTATIFLTSFEPGISHWGQEKGCSNWKSCSNLLKRHARQSVWEITGSTLPNQWESLNFVPDLWIACFLNGRFVDASDSKATPSCFTWLTCALVKTFLSQQLPSIWLPHGTDFQIRTGSRCWDIN